MIRVQIIRVGYQYYAPSSWIDGTKLVQLYYRQIKTEDDVLARALWLERNGHIEQAEELLEEYSANRH